MQHRFKEQGSGQRSRTGAGKFGTAAIAALIAAAALLGGCRSASITTSTVEQSNQSVPAQPVTGALPARPVIGSVDYRVGPLDVLDMEVFGVPALTRSVRVSEDGEISVPLIGRVPVAGKTVSEVEKEVGTRLSQGFLEKPQVTVFVKDYMSQRVTVEGAVRKPGIYALTGRTSLLQIVALSEGLDELANPKGIVIYRNIGDKRYAAAFDIREIRAGRLVDPEVIGHDIVVVDYSGARSNLRDFLIAVPAMALFLVL
jgi:polysaccharide export outer membrane protein